MRTLTVIAFMFLSLQLEAQNIVPNGGFEDVITCPTGGGGIWGAPPWRSSRGSPDLYNICGDFGFSVPENQNGTQQPSEGHGYSGIGTYFNHPSFVDTREFLNYPLVEDDDYYVEYYVSQSDSTQYATHNLGVTFTDVDTGEFGELLCWPDCDVYVENTSTNPLTSKTEWIKVSGTFTALGGEQYIHIGNFSTDEDSEIEFVGGGVGPEYDWFVAGYYIDDVWLSHVDSMHYVSVDEELGIENYALDIYPNPNTGSFTIQLNQHYNQAELVVWDVSGKTVRSWELKAGANQVETRLNSGLYLYGVLVNGQLQLSGKISVIED